MVARGRGVDDGLQLLLGEPEIAHVDLILAVLKVGHRQLVAVEYERVIAGAAGERVVAAKAPVEHVVAVVASQMVVELRAKQVRNIRQGVDASTPGVTRT
jgi:hypothetical protein